MRTAASVGTRVLPSPVFISAILPWWRTTPPISWTSKWRIPRVRCIASRAAAKTSGRTSSRALSTSATVASCRLFAELAAALGVEALGLLGGQRLLVGDLADLLADLVDALADLVVRERGELLLELVGAIDVGLDAFELALVRVDEPVQEAKHGTASIGRGPAGMPAGARRR